MPKKIVRTKKFNKRFKSLGNKDQKDVKDALTKLIKGAYYPGLNIRKFEKQPYPDILFLKANANPQIRIIFVDEADRIAFIDVGSHDKIARTKYGIQTLLDLQ